MPDHKDILTINGGSSSVKIALYKTKGFPGPDFSVGAEAKTVIKTKGNNYDHIFDEILNWIEKQQGIDSIAAIGHRVVHGMKYTRSVVITSEVLRELKDITIYDPDHLPAQIKLIELLGKRYPAVKQIACFDTSFHQSMPAVAKMLSIPRHYYEKGIRRYGFHGLSYSYLIEELKKLAGSGVAGGKIIIAHLGSGASLCAVQEGKSMDTSMAFTPASGIPMSTRSGDLDPGVAFYLMKSEDLSPEGFSYLVNHQSGLLGLSGTSSDMYELMKIKNTDYRAAEAVDFFCYQVKKSIGAFAAALEGLDALVFTGGIGENAWEIRQQICNGLSFLGLELDRIKNKDQETIISTNNSKVTAWVIKTDEEIMIARSVLQVINTNQK